MTLWSKGFRPFFWLGALYAALMPGVWLHVSFGLFGVHGPLAGVVWHGHEMIHGFTAAILAGFLLTAVSNWTGRETATGRWLAGLVALWLAGRVAMAIVPGWLGSAIDLLFEPALIVAVARPLWATGNRRNAFLPALLGVLWGANVATHLDAAGLLPGIAIAANRFAVHVVIVVILAITSRVVPMFTRNATGAKVVSDPTGDRIALGAAALVAVLQPAAPAIVVGPLAAVAACAVAWRARGWRASSAVWDPLVWVLHLGHAWVVVGLSLNACASFRPAWTSAALHALTVGAIGMLTLGMMARVALGHTGRPLRAPASATFGFAAIGVAALVRVAGPIAAPALVIDWLWLSALLWAFAFLAYAIRYAPILFRRRVDGLPG